MRRTRSALTRTALLVVAGVFTVGVASGCSPDPEPEPDEPQLEGQRYVALGDSYASGYGVPPYTDEPAEGCFQSEDNYPHQLAAQLDLQLDDRTCGGAVTANIIDTPQDVGGGPAPVQSEALSDDVGIVTVTIGGNDLGFGEVVNSCIAVSRGGPLLNDIDGTTHQTCRDAYRANGDDVLTQRLNDEVAPRLDAVFALITERAPNARVFAVGYPSVAPGVDDVPAGGCWTSPLGENAPFPPFPENSYPFTDLDTIYFHSIQSRLDAAFRTAAEAHGATYISTLDASSARSACAPAGEAFINGITVEDRGGGGLDYGVAMGAMHPNAAGIAFLADEVAPVIRAQFDE